MRIGTLVIWNKTDPRDDRPEATKRIPGFVNEVWPDQNIVSLFVLSPDGQFISRQTPVSQLEIVADPEFLASLMDALPTMLQRMLADIEGLKGVPANIQIVHDFNRIDEKIAKVSDDWVESAKQQGDRITELGARIADLEKVIKNWTSSMQQTQTVDAPVEQTHKDREFRKR